MLYDLRIYEAHPGKAGKMRERFCQEVAPRFAAHGIELLGCFTTPDQPDTMSYLTRYASDEARKAAWASFGSDEGWKSAKAASETDGPLLKAQTIHVLEPHLANLLLG